jgi:DNA-binding response OmpR family regulator
MTIERIHPTGDGSPRAELLAVLDEQGIEAVVVSSEEDLDSISGDSPPQLALVDMSSMSDGDVRRCVRRCVQLKIPVISLVPEDRVDIVDLPPGIDDFAIVPARPGEVATRARRVLLRTRSPDDADSIRMGDLVINPTTYEVTLRGRRITLRFKEYEVLRLLASNPGRVYTREALLSQIWGFDYFGGTRTVDVHIRRLRSKIEDADHSFIETVWNVGYRFRGPSS